MTLIEWAWITFAGAGVLLWCALILHITNMGATQVEPEEVEHDDDDGARP